MATTDDTAKALPSKPELLLGQLIEAQRGKMLQAHAVMTCVREIRLYAKATTRRSTQRRRTPQRCSRMT
jgi:hypothetical protein